MRGGRGLPARFSARFPSSLGEEGRADRLAKTLMERHISVSTAEPFCVTANVPQALRIALGSVPFDSLRAALVQVREAVEYEQYR